MLNFHKECWNPVKKHSKALVFFAVSKKIPIVYLTDRGRAEIIGSWFPSVQWNNPGKGNKLNGQKNEIPDNGKLQ